MAAPHHIVWDWNGTVFDDTEMIIDICNEVFQRAGFRPVSPEEFRAAYRRPVRAFYEDMIGAPMTDEQWTELDELFHEIYATRVHDVKLAHGVVEVFAHVTACGWTQSLLSMYPHVSLMSRISDHNLHEVFVRIDGSKEGSTGHSKSAYIKEHLDLVGVEPNKVTVIGDALDDLVAAEHVGAAAIFYSSGTHSEEVVASLTVPVARNMSDVLVLLKEMAGEEIQTPV